MLTSGVVHRLYWLALALALTWVAPAAVGAQDCASRVVDVDRDGHEDLDLVEDLVDVLVDERPAVSRIDRPPPIDPLRDGPRASIAVTRVPALDGAPHDAASTSCAPMTWVVVPDGRHGDDHVHVAAFSATPSRLVVPAGTILRLADGRGSASVTLEPIDTTITGLSWTAVRTMTTRGLLRPAHGAQVTFGAQHEMLAAALRDADATGGFRRLYGHADWVRLAASIADGLHPDALPQERERAQSDLLSWSRLEPGMTALVARLTVGGEARIEAVMSPSLAWRLARRRAER